MPIPNNDKDLSLKRYAARIAMEGEAEKARREAEERIIRDKELATEAIRQKELDKKATEERALKDKKDAEEREKIIAVKASTEIKSEVEKIKSVGAQIGPLRTLKRDMDEMIKERSISLARIAMEEDSRKRSSAGIERKEVVKNWTMVIVSIVFVISGIATGGYVYLKYQMPQTTLGETVSPIKSDIGITTESRKEISLTNISPDKAIIEIKNSVLNSNVSAGSLQKIILIKLNSEKKQTELTSQEFFGSINSLAPGDLTRSLGAEMLLGVLNTVIGAKSGILIFNVDSYQNAFASMLRWEKGSLVRDIYEIITGMPSNEFLTIQNFEDLVLNNQDTRILKDERGEIVLVYGFLNGKKLIIAGNTHVFNETLTRLRNSPNQ